MTKAPLPLPRRSDQAKARILAAAREVFSEKGYEAATVRQIAERAAIHASMITRYFETKDQLFALACDVPLGLPDLARAERADIGALLAERFVTLWEGADSNGQLQALLRASVSREDARQKVVHIFETQVQVAIAGIAGLDGAVERAGFVSSLLLGLAYSRYIARIPPIAELRADALQAGIAPLLQSIFDLPLRQGVRQPSTGRRRVDTGP